MVRASAICLVGAVSLCGWANSHESPRYEIAFASFAPLNTDIFIADGDGGEIRILISGSVHYNFPGWSPTRDLIAFTSDIDGDYEIYTINRTAPNSVG